MVFNRRHLSLQYLTSSQQVFHFFRQINGRLQTMQLFSGKSAFLRIFMVLLQIISFGVKQSAAAIVCNIYLEN
jgi:hypothetical protein